METLIYIKTVWGGRVRVRKADLDNGKVMLPLYNQRGLRKTGRRQRRNNDTVALDQGDSTYIHRDNIVPPGAVGWRVVDAEGKTPKGFTERSIFTDYRDAMEVFRNQLGSNPDHPWSIKVVMEGEVKEPILLS